MPMDTNTKALIYSGSGMAVNVLHNNTPQHKKSIRKLQELFGD